ncbi:hypothetical protein [Nocardiopsis rhodophaea]|uniref:hypothetical protein n=1 Tax=Nocardiopsis rhodophaea TaxID=280238 RepID=UPI0031DFDD41
MLRQPLCLCGWEGSLHRHERLANDEAAEHRNETTEEVVQDPLPGFEALEVA